LRFENTPHTQRIGHRLLNTGSSRYYNYVDWDGTLVGTPGKWIIGSASSEWWRWNSECYNESAWNMWVCPKKPGVEVGTIDLYIPGYIDNFMYPPDDMYRSDITQNIGITGVTNHGWYIHLNGGSPKESQIYTKLIPPGTFIIVAMRYPTTTTFTITARTPQTTVSQVNNFEALLSYSTPAWYFDTTTGLLYVKLINMRPDNNQFTRDGVTLFTQERNFYYSYVKPPHFSPWS
jgi:hypothetical protein